LLQKPLLKVPDDRQRITFYSAVDRPATPIDAAETPAITTGNT
jgi:hypothetical protein